MDTNSNHYQKACMLHQQIPAVDAHNDLAGEILLRHKNEESKVIERLYLPYWEEAGFRLIVSSVYVENAQFFPVEDNPRQSSNAPNAISKDWNYYWTNHLLCWDQGYSNALEQIQALKREIEESPDLCLVTNQADLELVRNQKRIGILLYMEGLDCIGEDLSRLHTLYQLGVRGASLTWSRPNLLATGCCTAVKHQDIPGSITSLGWKVIQTLQELHMFLDISHLNNEGWKQVNDWYTAHNPKIPYVATHSNAYQVCSNYRNLTDQQMKALAEQGGIMGLNACKYIVGSENPEEYLDRMYEHLEYALNLIGPRHLGFGFDLCDSYEQGKHQRTDLPLEDCLANHKEAPLLTARLLERGLSEQNALRIIGLNWLEYFENLLSETPPAPPS